MRYDDDVPEWKTTRIDNSRPPLRWMANLAGHFASKAVLRISFYEEAGKTGGFRFKRDCWIWDNLWPIYDKWGTVYRMDFEDNEL